MNAEELTLNIAVNLGRVSRWAQEGKKDRIVQFLEETENYVKDLKDAKKKPGFQKTFQIFYKKFYDLKGSIECNDIWAEETLTWANILSHRAKIA